MRQPPGLTDVENRQEITEAAETVRQQPPDDGLIVTIRQPHGNDVVALAENGAVDLRRPLADYHQPNPVFPALFGDPFKNPDRNLIR